MSTTVLPAGGGPVGPIDLVEGISPCGSRAGVVFLRQVECHGCRGSDNSTAELQTRPEIGGNNSKPNVAVDIGRRKSMPGDEVLKLRLRDIAICLSAWQEPGVDRARCAYPRGQKSFIFKYVRDLSRMRLVSEDLGPGSKPWREPPQALQREGSPQSGPVNWIERKRLVT